MIHHNETLKTPNQITPFADQIMRVQTLSRDSKRIIIKLPKIIPSTGKSFQYETTKLSNISLKFKPNNPDLKSGFRLQRVRKIIRKMLQSLQRDRYGLSEAKLILGMSHDTKTILGSIYKCK